MTNRSISGVLPAGSFSDILSPAGHWNRHKEDSGTVNCQLTTVNCLSPLIPTIPAPLATAALRIVPAPIFTTTSSTHVGAPTFLLRERTTATQQIPDRRVLLFSNCALLTFDCELLSSPKSNHSRTYTKTGGVGSVIRMVTSLKYVGAPTFSSNGGWPAH